MNGEPVTCARCGTPSRAGDEVCRRCGADLPERAPLPDLGLPHAPALAVDRESFSLLWTIVALVGFVGLLFALFQIFKDAFAEYAEVLLKLRTPADVRRNADVLSEFALKAFVLVFCSYLAGGILVGRFTPGRVLPQSALAALLSWLVIFFQGGGAAVGALLLPMLIGAGIVTGTAALGAWVGRALRPKRRATA